MRTEALDEVFAVNVRTWLCTRAVVPAMECCDRRGTRALARELGNGT
ncbi:MAG: hypothetical protein MSC30_09195 [Gaiellaceae bacterium MAG52_C11]|nr:hypothetical protein [Candidatus Gaiellasilicea maunaloa]